MSSNENKSNEKSLKVCITSCLKKYWSLILFVIILFSLACGIESICYRQSDLVTIPLFVWILDIVLFIVVPIVVFTIFNKVKLLDKVLGVLECAFRRILRWCIKFFNSYWPLILMNVIIFSLAVFIESIYIYNIGTVYSILNLILFITVPTIIFCVIGRVKSYDIIISIPILYVLFLMFLNFCTIRDLYGITSGSLDNIPNYIDALFVVFIFTFVEYIPAIIIKGIKNRKNKKEE